MFSLLLRASLKWSPQPTMNSPPTFSPSHLSIKDKPSTFRMSRDFSLCSQCRLFTAEDYSVPVHSTSNGACYLVAKCPGSVGFLEQRLWPNSLRSEAESGQSLTHRTSGPRVRLAPAPCLLVSFFLTRKWVEHVKVQLRIFCQLKKIYANKNCYFYPIGKHSLRDWVELFAGVKY